MKIENIKLLEKLLNEFLDEEGDRQGMEFGKETVEKWFQGYDIYDLLKAIKDYQK